MKPNQSHSHKAFIFASIALCVLTLIRCTEDPLEISPNILPGDNSLEIYIDSIPVELYTVSMDALAVRGTGISPLGSVNDNVVGNLQTDFFADFMYAEEPSFANETDLDSISVIDLVVEFVYRHDRVYGDLGSFRFNVYELLEPIPQYTRSDFVVMPHMYSPEPLNESMRLINRIYHERDLVDTCQVTLDNSFAQRFLDSTLISQDIYYSENQSAFKDYFKGFYFAVNPRVSTGGAIIQIDHTYSKMTLRTKEWNDNDEKFDTVSTIFTLGNPASTVDSGGVHLNMYRSTFEDNVNAIINDTVNLHESAYIQSLAGPQVYVKLPTLNALRDSLDGLASINRAQLILPVDMDIYSGDHELFSPPNLLGLYDSKTKDAIIDFTVASSHMGGKLDTSDTEDVKYILNIENHLHNYLRDSTSTYSSSFYLFAATIEQDPQTKIDYLRHTKNQPGRTVLNGSSSSKPPYVRIVYSKIRE